ncbi:MAG: DUF4340 domain-containing protein [Saprospiraceae bacterium]|nr:DUF4340 domain-containing protein [Saprospiraceae bacterium]
MNRTVGLILLFLFLGFGAWFALKKTSQSASSSSISWDRDFKIENTEGITKIFLADKRGKTAILEKQDDGWWTIDGGRRANPFIHKNMLEVVSKMEYQYLLGKAEEENVIKRMATSGIKVELYDKNDKNVSTFYVGPNSRNHEGTYFMKEGSEHPQIMNIPGFVGDLRPRFEIAKERWWDKTVIGEDPKKIQRVRVFYPKQKSASFEIEKMNGEWTAKPLDPLVPPFKAAPNAELIETYLENFSSRIAEGIRNGHPSEEEITKQIPFAEVTTQVIDGPEKTISFYPIYPELRDDASVLQASSEVERMWAKETGGDYYTTQLRVFSPIFRSYKSFY